MLIQLVERFMSFWMNQSWPLLDEKAIINLFLD